MGRSLRFFEMPCCAKTFECLAFLNNVTLLKAVLMISVHITTLRFWDFIYVWVFSVLKPWRFWSYSSPSSHACFDEYWEVLLNSSADVRWTLDHMCLGLQYRRLHTRETTTTTTARCSSFHELFSYFDPGLQTKISGEMCCLISRWQKNTNQKHIFRKTRFFSKCLLSRGSG